MAKVSDHWESRSISDLCDFSSGYGFRPTDWSDSGLPIIRIQNLNGSGNFNYYAGVPRQEWLVEPGTILFAWAGTKGVSFGPKIWNGPIGVLNQHIYRIHPRTGVDRDWLFLALQIITNRIEQKAHGFKATLLHVRKADITEQKVKVPPLGEQRKIAAILGTWDEAIAQTEQLIAALQLRNKGLMQRLLTGQVRFPGFGDEWRETMLGEFFSEFAEKNSNGSDLTVLSCSKVHGIVPQTEIFDKRVASTDTRRYKIVQRGDLVYDPMLLWDASIGFVEVVDQGIISPAYNTFNFDEESGNRSFFKHLLMTHYYREHYKFISQGTNVRRRKAPAKAFLGLKVALPRNRAEQDMIAEVLELVQKEIDTLESYAEHLKRQKKGLMQRLLTGQIRVTVDEE